MIQVGDFVTIGRSDTTWRVVFIDDRPQPDVLLVSGVSGRRRREPLFILHFHSRPC